MYNLNLKNICTNLYINVNYFWEHGKIYLKKLYITPTCRYFDHGRSHSFVESFYK